MDNIWKTVDFVCYALVLLCVIWLPIPWGSRPEWSVYLMEILILSIALMCFIAQLINPNSREIIWKPSKAVIIFLVAWLIYQIFQLIPLPSSIVQIIEPNTHALYNANTLQTDFKDVYSISVDRGTSLKEAIKNISYVVLFILVFVLITSRRRLVVLASTIFVVGVAESIFGIYALATNLRYVPEEVMEGHRWVTGTFLNRNHFAGHIVMVIGVGLGLLFLGNRLSANTGGARKLLILVIDYFLSFRGWILICVVVLFSGLFLSESRGGALSIIGSLSLTLAFTFVIRKNNQNRAIKPVAIILIIILAATWLGTGDLTTRFKDISEDERLRQWKLTSTLIKDHMIFGIGGGNYQWVFQNYRDGSLRIRTYDHAHQDYLELLAEHGLVGFALLALAIIFVLKNLLIGYMFGKSNLSRSITFGTLVSLLGMLLHGMVDFNFRVPANAAYFYIIAALGLASLTLDNRNNIRHERT